MGPELPSLICRCVQTPTWHVLDPNRPSGEEGCRHSHHEQAHQPADCSTTVHRTQLQRPFWVKHCWSWTEKGTGLIKDTHWSLILLLINISLNWDQSRCGLESPISKCWRVFQWLSCTALSEHRHVLLHVFVSIQPQPQHHTGLWWQSCAWALLWKQSWVFFSEPYLIGVGYIFCWSTSHYYPVQLKVNYLCCRCCQ